MVSTIDTIALDGDEEIDIRGWIRTFADSGKPIYVGIYTSFRHQDRGNVSVGFPIPNANFTATLLPCNAGEHDFVLTSRTELAFPGHYLSSVDSERDALTVLKLALFPKADLRARHRRRAENRPQLLPGRTALPDAPLRDRTPGRRTRLTQRHRDPHARCRRQNQPTSAPSRSPASGANGTSVVTATTMPSAKPSTAPTAMVAPRLMCASLCSLHGRGDPGRPAAGSRARAGLAPKGFGGSLVAVADRDRGGPAHRAPRPS
jgi:hypothetical protein